MRSIRALKLCAGTVLILMILFFAVVGWCFFTESGTKTSLGTLQGSLKKLSYTYESGNLAQGINLKDVSWALNNDNVVHVNKLSLKWNPRCWRGREFCLHNTTAERLIISLATPGVERNPIVLNTVTFPLTLVARDLSIKQLLIKRPDKKTIELNNIDFSGKLSGSTVAADSLSVDWNRYSIDADGEIELSKNYPLLVDGTLVTQSSPGGLPVQGNFTLSGDLLNTKLRSSLRYPYTSTVQGELSLLTRGTPLNLDIHCPQAQLPVKSAKPLIYLRESNLQLSGLWPDYELSGTAEASGPQLPAALATLDGVINTQELTFDQLHFQTLNGAIAANGVLNYQDGIEWNSALTLENIEPHRHWSVANFKLNGTSQFNGRFRNGQSEMHLTNIAYNGVRANLQFVMSGNVHKAADNGVHIDSLEINSQDNTATVNGVLSDDSNLSVYFSLRQPGLLLPGISGDLNGELSVTGNKFKPDINGSASAGALRYQHYGLTNTRIKAQLHAKGTDFSRLTIDSESATDGKKKLHNIQIEAAGTIAEHKLNTRFQHTGIALTSSTLSGTLDANGNWRGTLDQANGAMLDRSIKLNKPFNLAWVADKKYVTLQPHCWSVEASSACITKPALLGKNGAVNFTLSNFDINDLQAILPETIQNASGTLKTVGNLQWKSFSKPTAWIRASVKNGAMEIASATAKQAIPVNVDTADLRVTTSNHKIESVARFRSKKSGMINARMQFDFDKVQTPLRGTIEFSEAPIDWLAEYYPQLGISKGTIKSNINLTGTLAEPSFNGQLQVVNANYKSPALPTPLEDLNLDISFANNDITILGRAQTLGKPLHMQGIAKADSDNWQADLNLSGDDIALEHEYVKNATISPRLQVRIDQNAINIGGKIHLPKADIKLPDLLSNGIPISKDVVIVDAAAKDKQRPVNSGPLAISADVDLDLGRNVSFSGYGLDADIHGDLNVQLQPQRIPELLGEIFVDTGTYKAYGQSLKIRDGRINFTGPLEQTSISVEAVRDTGNVLAGIRINGSMDAPLTDLFSEPPLPEEEILPYLVLGRPMTFGRSQSSDSQLITRAALFMGLTNGQNLTNNIASNLGIEDFSMTALGSGEDTQVQLSGRLNKRLLIRYGLGVFNSVNTLFLRYNLAEKLYLETTQGLERAVDVYYSFEFD